MNMLYQYYDLKSKKVKRKFKNDGLEAVILVLICCRNEMNNFFLPIELLKELIKHLVLEMKL